MKVQAGWRTGCWLRTNSVMMTAEVSAVIFSMRKAFLPFIVLWGFSFQASAQSQNISKMYGAVGVTTNYVDRGISQSNKGPSLNAGAGYWFGGMGRIGFESASVTYPNESASVEMRLFGEYKFVFTPNSDLRVRNDWIRYFSEGRRDKTIILLDQNFFTYHILASREDNFEGTKTPRNWFAFHKDWPLGTSFQINGTVGYSMVQDYNNFFDTRFGISYLMSNVVVALTHTYVSSSAQFGSLANSFVILSVDAKF